jgi:hypothetical protein
LAVKQWNVGDVLTAADMNAWTVPLVGIKSANQTISSQATLINDADMRFAVAANAMYEFHAFIRYSSGTGQDWKQSFTVPAGASAHFSRYSNSAGTFAGDGDFADTDTPVSQGAGVGAIRTINLFGWLSVAGTAGNLVYQWAQSTSGAFNTVLYQNSYLTGRRIG